MFLLRLILGLLAVAVASKQTARPPGAEERTVTDVTFDNSYAEGGEKVTPENLGLTRVEYAECTVIHGTESAELQVASAWYDEEKELLHLVDVGTGKELAKEKDASKVKVRVVAYGH